jgi:peptide/nickel transport system ATP-binding protein
MTEPILRIEGLRVAIGRGARATPILRGVDLAVAPGEVHGLVGESGAGKSMIGRAVLGLLPGGARITAGTVSYGGLDMAAIGPRGRQRLLGREIALVPQDPTAALNPVRLIGRQITDVLRLRLGLGRAEAARRAVEILAETAIRDPERVVQQYPHELSGGMRQRVLIGIAFAGRPRLIVADEPTTALDVTAQREILRLIRQLQGRHGSAVLFVTHDLGVVAKICQRVTVLHAGRVVEEGDIAHILQAPRHPYTGALLAAMPRVDRPDHRPAPIPAALTDRLWAEAHAFDATATAGAA